MRYSPVAMGRARASPPHRCRDDTTQEGCGQGKRQKLHPIIEGHRGRALGVQLIGSVIGNQQPKGPVGRPPEGVNGEDIHSKLEGRRSAMFHPNEADAWAPECAHVEVDG
ncbi:MAG: hypothetical protein GWP91_11160 [Rhodobacterales bacterium]|nr:hypothetical protein [Rhodobacterales bacterium]